jgi:hypothetical protein
MLIETTSIHPNSNWIAKFIPDLLHRDSLLVSINAFEDSSAAKQVIDGLE